MSVTLRLAVAEQLLGRLTDANWPGIAARALAEGTDSPNLRILAGLPEEGWQDIRRLRDLALSELGVPRPESKRAASLLVARRYAAGIVAGTTPPYEGARAIWSLWDDQDYPEELLAFVGGASQIDDYIALRVSDPATYDGYIRSCEDGIRESAHELVSAVAT